MDTKIPQFVPLTDVEVVEGDISQATYFKCQMVRDIAVDIETSGLDKKKDKIACVQLFTRHSENSVYDVSVIVRNPTRGWLTQLLEDPIGKIFHHAEFDLAFLMRDFQITPRNVKCTKILARIVDPARTMFYDPVKEKAAHTLRALAYTVKGITLDKSLAVSDWFKPVLDPAQLNYAMDDVRYLEDICNHLASKLNPSQIKKARETFAYLPTKIQLEIEDGIENPFGYESR